ncbi:hypothetical protein E3P92_01198 [Wallemia ichthyophaga]|uniref:Uncharacterized protein n=2 Tax=Wallemia ichthyophaga TaxID=245174 RepID=A0A4T0HLA2_WALIC|nr:Serine/threonine/tyrosine-interacting protein [Wallemia ichthyophaga EXF-994]TIA74426.1 hypothetical protein E3P91_00905 [Wallemia ichthyophaga]EOR00723.1 Serine/threonine/tyrosine-interacting protein [Wallemia ichthyophaga EXF-994]TIA82942.1 hypothetical protein E3P98_01136 [Wallemia ichthyophaga]TIA92859.1 hypothetical protein E3P97_01212 [Wallemia ichthyophaga]TIA98163.1 hypothetical protein E3P95_02518 [Wallemia ichthyophaga]
MDIDKPSSATSAPNAYLFDGVTDWRYEMRRECQEIIPGLILGPYQCSKDTEYLRSTNITHIICIRGEAEAVFVRPRFPDQFKYLVLDVRDSEEQNLIRIYPQARSFIYNALELNGKVLIVCNGGISRGPAITIMYVMEAAQLSFEEATHYVQNKRYCISPNLGFQSQLKEFESIYKASLAMANQPNSNLFSQSKRSLEDVDSLETTDIDTRPTQNQRI